MRRALLVLALLAAHQGTAQAQDDNGAVRVRLVFEDGVKVGRAAPDLQLPYATKDGAGPADQPFDLKKELGHVVVLAFYAGDFTPASTSEWQAFKERAGTTFNGVVVAGISADSLATHIRFASENELPFKLLTDADLAVTRRFAFLDGTQARRAVVVIGRDGRVRYVDAGFAALDPQSYVHLGSAIQTAKEKS